MNQNHTPDSVSFLAVACVFIACWTFWHFFHQPVTEAFRHLRYGELWLIGQIVSNGYVTGWRDFLHEPRNHVEWANIKDVSRIVGYYLRYPVAAILLIMAYFAAFHAPKAIHKKTHSLDTLIAVQAKVWPIISPVVTFNPASSSARSPNSREPIPSDLPLFAEALSPEEWLRWNKIAPYDTIENERTTDPLDREAAFAAFAEQLGPRWRGTESLPWHAKALFAAFALKMARKREEADDLLGELAQIADSKKGMALRPGAHLRARVDRIVADPKLGGEAAKVANRHGYVAPALMALLLNARERGGVLAPAQFLWLRGAHRALWYPLNNLGRQSFHPEAAGAVAHYQAELAAGSPLYSPKVERAVETIEQHTRHKERGSLPALLR